MTRMSNRGVTLHVKVIGQGYPLAIMHGGPGADLNTMMSLKPCADQFTLVFYDHRCNGRSEGAEITTMTMENLTADADALRQALGFEKWAVLGHSFGGYVALEYALRYPQNLSHLLLIDTGGDSRWSQENAPKVLEERGFRPEIVNLFRRFINGQIEPREMFPSLMKLGKAYNPYTGLRQFPHMISMGLQVKLRPEALIFGARYLKGWTVMDRLGEIQAPTLVIAGREDFQFPPEHQEELAAGIPNARLVLIDRAGHNPHDERPAEVQRAIRAFLGDTHPRSPAYAEIDACVERHMRRLHIPGASLAIVEGDKIVHQRGFGRARPRGETPTPQTPFFIGSLTKSFTALAVMQLVEAGKIELDAPVQRYLPWFRVADPQASAQITVRHLLNQTSGLPLWPSEIALADFDDSPDAVERQVRALSSIKIKRPVGSKCEYSNFNYNILGLIVQAVSGQSYAGYVRNHIFNPLEMRYSYTAKADAKPNGLAVGHRHWFSLPFPVPDMPVPGGSLPSGQLISCAEDMARYLIAHLNGGRCGGVQILSQAGIDEMHRGVAEIKMGDISGGFYGMGWFDIDLGRTKTYSHGGNVPDFSAFMAIVPEYKKGVILLFNADPYGLPIITEEIGMDVTALLAGQPSDPIRLDFIQWVMRSLPLIPLLQIAGVFATLRLLRRWRKEPERRPGRRRIWGQHILLPLVPNLALAGILGALQSSRLIRFLHLFLPDLAWIIRVSGIFAGIWAVLRTGLMLQALRKPRR